MFCIYSKAGNKPVIVVLHMYIVLANYHIFSITISCNFLQCFKILAVYAIFTYYIYTELNTYTELKYFYNVFLFLCSFETLNDLLFSDFYNLHERIILHLYKGFSIFIFSLNFILYWLKFLSLFTYLLVKYKDKFCVNYLSLNIKFFIKLNLLNNPYFLKEIFKNLWYLIFLILTCIL